MQARARALAPLRCDDRPSRGELRCRCFALAGRREDVVELLIHACSTRSSVSSQMATLYRWPEAHGLPSVSPACLQVEVRR